MLFSRGLNSYLFQFQAGHKACLTQLGSMYYPVCIIATDVEDQYIGDVKLAMESQQMFSIREQDTPECVKLDVLTIEG